MKQLYKSEVDVAVLFLFFTRIDITVRTFEQIRKGRPSRLYLFQDGPRKDRQEDVDNISVLRKKIEEMIDWECEIHCNYQDKNLGCDPSEYISQKWMFKTEDKGIIIEDDDVMSVSFFRFCKELLDRYENDSRVNMICGMNHLGVYEECPYDYFFSRNGGAIWGWATWKRVIDKWDPSYKFLSNKYICNCVKGEFGNKLGNYYISVCEKHLSVGKEHYESIGGSYLWTNCMVNIVPKYNMTCNIGVGIESTHSTLYHKLPFSSRRQLFMKTYEMRFPLVHPLCVQADYLYWKKVNKQIRGNLFVRLFQIHRIVHIIFSFFPALGKWVTRFEKDKQFE